MSKKDSIDKKDEASVIPSMSGLVNDMIKNKDILGTSGLGSVSKALSATTWNINGFFNQDGTIKVTTALKSPSQLATGLGIGLSVENLHRNKQLLGVVKRDALITGIAKDLSGGFAESSNLLATYKLAVNEQSTLLSQVGKLTGMLGVETSSFVNKNISPLSSTLTEIGLTSVNTGRLYSTGMLTSNAFNLIEGYSALCLQSVQTEQNSLSNLLNQNNKISIENYLPFTSFISTGINTLLHSLPSYPSDAKIPQLRKVEEFVQLDEKGIYNHQKTLDNLLREIDPELVEYRLGCWEVFNNKGKDYIGQSSSSMRRLVDKLFRIIAPIEEVEKTKYFKQSPKAKDPKGYPTREARIYYVANYEKDKRNHVERLAKGFVEAWNNLSAWDHEPLNKDGFVYGSLIVIEGHLISLLSAHRGNSISE